MKTLNEMTAACETPLRSRIIFKLAIIYTSFTSLYQLFVDPSTLCNRFVAPSTKS